MLVGGGMAVVCDGVASKRKLVWCGVMEIVGIHAIVSRRAWRARYKLQSVEPAFGLRRWC